MTLEMKKLATYKDVARLVLKYGRSDELDHQHFASEFQLDEQVEPSEDAVEFAKDLESLGPTFIKLGQILSNRGDLLPPSWLSALEKLQDDVEPFAFETVKETIETEVGVRISKLFDEFDETPMATASLGQVHLATLRNSDTRVAVKVQRPNIREQIMRETEVIASIAEFLEKHTEVGKQTEPTRMVEQFRKSILAELNYQQEAANLDRLRNNLKKFEQLTVPKPHPDFCTGKVLVMDYIDGTKITDIPKIALIDLDGKALAEELFSAYLQQILLDGFFHADPHPGNLLLTKEGKIALIDLGMTGAVPDRIKDQLLQLLAAISEGRSSDAASITMKIGTPREHFDLQGCREAITEIVENYQGLDVGDIYVGQLVMEITQACGKNGLRIPDVMFMLGKMLLNLDGVGNILDRHFTPNDTIRDYTTTIARKRMREELTAGSLVPFIIEIKELVSKTPERLNTLIERISTNQMELKIDAIDEPLLLKGLYQVANRITTGLIIAAMIIGAAMLMNIETSFTLLGYPGLAILLFLTAAIGGTVLVVNIFLTERK
ncbi:AarF/ABC1/UbiB kinase family protein [Verrucomicrobiaceae bacterium R5-34]|nr:AarF/ABC1/UbiB kinase family protein [Verrucomicrobiaceae bacterium R5-34]